MVRYIIKIITIADDEVVIVHDDLIMHLIKVYSTGELFCHFASGLNEWTEFMCTHKNITR